MKLTKVTVESTSEKSPIGVFNDKIVNLDVIPESGEDALVIVTNEEKEESKLLIRRVRYESNSLILEKLDEHRTDMAFAGRDLKNVMILGRVEHPHFISTAYPNMIKPIIKRQLEQESQAPNLQQKGENK